MTAGWGTRTTRAAMFAAVCVLLAALGHVLMSGGHVPWWALAVGVVATGAGGWCLAGRERGLPLITSVVVAAQTALHWSFELAQPMGSMGADSMGASSAGASSADAGSANGAMDMGSAHMNHTVHMGPAGHMNHVDPSGYFLDGADASSSGMFAAHLLAALLCGLWLAHGERAAFALLRAVAGRLAAPLRLALALPVAAERPRPRVRRGRTDRSPRRLLLVHAITSRGPPAGTAVS
ncbi:hypothetical protein PV755_01070 [Streptomyces caniscabiei]|uniref:Integral-membrane protein n=1 Tax=Streptomyces caniscabiei TaxID=2746961 RepID=A0A927L595_9ACTN|nr:hypothetical protein [Streptomyces caniscabiei]MBD9725815.1 hypothetical protein [Streptomyces caniscabiei]MDX3507526.1 hypothetical protein [Streptomyces caniscabiei]MDX3717488.1 hypothetical protein [Streptomyces caniscabiei]WEO25243.1 hypothetical protein IHE65_19810 [Streptomyces caniscabiei]